MDWANERYVRAYTRNTGDLLAIGWQGRTVWWELLRAADRCGIIELGDEIEVLADMLRLPVEVVEVGFAAILKRKMAYLTTSPVGIVIPNYIPANETPMSTAMRSREYRERERSQRRLMALESSMQQNVTDAQQNVAEPSRGATPRHAPSRAVTPCRSDPCRSDPCTHSDARAHVDGIVPPPGPPPGRYQIAEAIWRAHIEARERLRTEGIDPAHLRPLSLVPPSTMLQPIADLLAAGFTEADLRHVLEHDEAECRAKRSAEYFDPGRIWTEKHVRIAMAREVPVVSRPAGGRILDMEADLAREEAEAKARYGKGAK
jgi:hypothetical protein